VVGILVQRRDREAAELGDRDLLLELVAVEDQEQDESRPSRPTIARIAGSRASRSASFTSS
jgi:hypothetical protein